jgi:CDP-glucose 4,6-dehydratase
MLRYPDSVRPWQYVLDPIRGYLILAEKLWEKGRDYAQGWNFGPSEDPVPVIEVVRKSSALWKDNAKWEIQESGHPSEAKYLKLDSSLAFSRLGWKNQLSINEVIEWTVSWYKAYYKGNQCMHSYSIDQISSYENLFS